MFRLYSALLFRIFAVAFSAVAAGVCIPAAAQPAADTLYTLDGAYALAGKNGALARQILIRWKDNILRRDMPRFRDTKSWRRGLLSRRVT